MLAGTGPLPDSLAGGTNAGIEVRNRYIPDRELSRLMQRASFVVVPYTSASQSGVVATAYAFGKPVISTSVGGLREMVVPGRTGLLVPGNDAISLARAMEILATKPQRLARLGRSATVGMAADRPAAPCPVLRNGETRAGCLGDHARF